MKVNKLCLPAALLWTLAGTLPAFPQLKDSKNQVGVTQRNTLTAEEKREGWKLLFDGSTTAGWRGAYREQFPESGWVIKDGALMSINEGGRESQAGGDIVTADEYSNFDLQFEWQLSAGGNSGVKYFVEERRPRPAGSTIGCEYQIIDDAKYNDPAHGALKEAQKTGALYDLIPARDKVVNPPGEWNQSRIVVRGRHVEHWLNGRKVVEYERGGESFRAAVAASKFKDYQGFGEAPRGRILLQDHGHKAAFRNIKIRAL